MQPIWTCTGLCSCLVFATLLGGCGGATDDGDGTKTDAGTEDSAIDASEDAAPDSTPDAAPDAPPDAPTDVAADTTTDASVDATVDATVDVVSDTALDAVLDVEPDSVADVLSDTPPDVVGDVLPPLDGGSTVTLSGIVNDFFGNAIAGAEVSVSEAPSLQATTGYDGRFTLMVPAEEPMTLHAEHMSYVDTIVQTAIPHYDTPLTLWMASPANYDIMVNAGGGSATDAVFYITIRQGTMPCDLTGSEVTTVPLTGQVVYGQADGYPNSSLTSLPSGSRWAYVVGPTGTTEPKLVSSTCTQASYPVNVGPVTILGPVTVRPGAFHVMDMVLQ